MVDHIEGVAECAVIGEIILIYSFFCSLVDYVFPDKVNIVPISFQPFLIPIWERLLLLLWP